VSEDWERRLSVLDRLEPPANLRDRVGEEPVTHQHSIDLDKKFQEVRGNEPPDLWGSIGTRVVIEAAPAPRRRWPALIVALVVGIGGLALAWVGFRHTDAHVSASAPVVTSPAPRQCPWGLVTPSTVSSASTVSSEQFLQLTNGRGPTWFPEGFGLAQAWGDRADWSDQTCREVTMYVYAGTQMPSQDVLGEVGGWLVIGDAPDSCGNAVLGRGRCLDYIAPTSDGLTFRLQMMGIDRPEGDRIALSISLAAGSSTPTPTPSTPLLGQALARELDLTLYQGQPSGCNFYVEVDNPAGYCLDAIGSSKLDRYVVSQELQGRIPSDAELACFSAADSAGNMSNDSPEFQDAQQAMLDACHAASTETSPGP
jgi:hypothetical protein